MEKNYTQKKKKKNNSTKANYKDLKVNIFQCSQRHDKMNIKKYPARRLLKLNKCVGPY